MDGIKRVEWIEWTEWIEWIGWIEWIEWAEWELLPVDVDTLSQSWELYTFDIVNFEARGLSRPLYTCILKAFSRIELYTCHIGNFESRRLLRPLYTCILKAPYALNSLNSLNWVNWVEYILVYSRPRACTLCILAHRAIHMSNSKLWNVQTFENLHPLLMLGAVDVDFGESITAQHNDNHKHCQDFKDGIFRQFSPV